MILVSSNESYMALKGDRIWVGIRLGGIPGGNDVIARTNLKGLCDDSGVSYNTAKVKAVKDDVLSLRSGDGGLWGFYRLELGKVGGRGNSDGVPRVGSSGGKSGNVGGF